MNTRSHRFSREIRYQFAPLPEVPDDLSAFTPEQLRELDTQLVAYFTEHRPNATTPEAVAELRQVVEYTTRVRQEIGRHEGFAADLAALDAQIQASTSGDPAEPGADPAEPTGDPAQPAGEPAQPAGDPARPAADPGAQPGADPDASRTDGGREVVFPQEATEALAAALTAGLAPVLERALAPRAATPARRSPYEPRIPEDQRPQRPRAAITAAADIPGVSMGQAFGGMRDVAVAMNERWRTIGRSGTGEDERVPVAQFRADYDSDRFLTHEDPEGNWAKIQRVVGHDALTAAGGLCAPVAPYYDLMVVASDARPVAEALPTFPAARGGIRLVPPPGLADLLPGGSPSSPLYLGNAVGAETVAQDAAGTFNKTCLSVPCNSITEYDVEAIWRCLEFSNLTARTFPEQVEAFNELAMAVWARTAETFLLDGIRTFANAQNAQVTAAHTFGTLRQVLAQIDHGAAYVRNILRMDPNQVVRAMAPAWILNAMRGDAASTFALSDDFLDIGEDELVGWFTSRAIEPAWYLDTPTGAGQGFTVNPANGDALPDYPTTAVVLLFVEGSILHLDAGTLDLGVVRDSSLNIRNRFRNFAESFEGVAYVGPTGGILDVTMTICADGSYGAAKTVACAAGSGL